MKDIVPRIANSDVCEWRPEDDEGNMLDQRCGKPARWTSCVPFTSTPTCDEHKCRCANPRTSVAS